MIHINFIYTNHRCHLAEKKKNFAPQSPAFTSAPLSSSKRTTSAWSLEAATWSGVPPGRRATTGLQKAVLHAW